ncbi:hypothetical protein Dimus_029782 [Dionaea muscipula]
MVRKGRVQTMQSQAGTEGRMGFQISHKVKENQLKPGDHIYTWRLGYLYGHHGIFLRSDKVIQLAPAAKGIDHREPKPAPCGRPKCGFRAANGSAVLRSCLRCFLGKRGVPRLYRYGVPAVDHMILRGGTCSTAKREPDPSVVVHRAKYLLKNGFGRYNLIINNCEDFAVYCSTGLVVLSGQVASVSRALTSLASIIIITIAASPFISGVIVLVETVCLILVPLMMAKHKAADIGVRKEFVKVRVELLVAILRADKSRRNFRSHLPAILRAVIEPLVAIFRADRSGSNFISNPLAAIFPAVREPLAAILRADRSGGSDFISNPLELLVAILPAVIQPLAAILRADSSGGSDFIWKWNPLNL